MQLLYLHCRMDLDHQEQNIAFVKVQLKIYGLWILPWMEMLDFPDMEHQHGLPQIQTLGCRSLIIFQLINIIKSVWIYGGNKYG